MKKTKKNKSVFAVVAVAVVVIICILLSVGALKGNDVNTDNTNSAKTAVEVYFMQNGETKLVHEKREVQGEDQEAIALATLEELKNGPKIKEYISALPDDVTFKSASLWENVLTIDVSSEYSNMKSGEEVLCRAVLVWTLTSIEGVDYILITVDGEPLKLTNGQNMEKIGREDIVLDAVVVPEETTFKTVKLYFADDQATTLKVEERVVEVNPNQPLEKYVLEQLILGPKDESLIATIPAETKIRDIKTTNDGICYVDLSMDFVLKHSGGSSGELLTIYSIVDSLTSLDNIYKVQFLIEGEKQEEFKGHVDFSQLFEFSEVDV